MLEKQTSFNKIFFVKMEHSSKMRRTKNKESNWQQEEENLRKGEKFIDESII